MESLGEGEGVWALRGPGPGEGGQVLRSALVAGWMHSPDFFKKRRLSCHVRCTPWHVLEDRKQGVQSTLYHPG